MHVAGVNADPATFEHIEPEVVGNDRERAGIRAVGRRDRPRARRRTRGSNSTKPAPRGVIERVKEREHEGYHYEAADGSFELLLRKETGEYEPLFTLESLARDRREAGRWAASRPRRRSSSGSDGERYVRTAEGNGPVNALDRALRDAIGEIYPHLADDQARELQGPHDRRARRAPTRSRAC